MKHSATKIKSAKAADTSPAKEAEPVTATPPDADPAPQQTSAEDRIRHSAYLRFLGRGDAAGSEVDDWLQAETEHARK